jgi:hypothetical protein
MVTTLTARTGSGSGGALLQPLKMAKPRNTERKRRKHGIGVNIKPRKLLMTDWLLMYPMFF